MVGILLAAGFSRRFGTANKLLQSMPDGRPIGLVSAINLVNAIPHSIAVLRPNQQALENLLLNAGLHVVLCDESQPEMADSLSTAIRYSAQFDAAHDGFVIALADMPYIQSATISKVANQLMEAKSIVIPTFNGQRGHPVGFAAKYADALTQLKGDEGARSVIQQHSSDVQLIPTNDKGILADIDTPADLAAAFIS
jgi:molybdenum cofactor cytidylyltransferase